MFTKRHTRQRVVVAGLALVALAVGALLLRTDLFDTTLQSIVYDKAIDIGNAPLANQVTIVALDDSTVDQYRYPLPRSVYTDLLRALKPLNPSVIAFDVGFYDAAQNPEEDRALAAAIKDAGNVLLAMQGSGTSTLGDHTERYPVVQLPIPVLRAAAAGVGSVNIHPDPDGRVRYAQLRIEGPEGAIYYSLPLVAATNKVRADLSSAQRTDDIFTVHAPLGDRVIPIDRRGGMSIYYAAPPAPEPSDCTNKDLFCVVSMKDVINGAVSREQITGRAVFIGAHSLSGVPDSYPVPNSSGFKMFGVEIWANAAQSILTNRYPVLKQSDPVTLAQLLVVTLAGLLLVFRWRLYGFLGALALLVLYVVGGYVLFALQTQGPIGAGPVEVPSIAYVIPAVFWWIILLGYLLVEEQITVARTRITFGRFVTPSVARTIIDREEAGKLALGGEEKRVTVLFGDIRGFTTISEGLAPEILLGHLNRYFDGMVDIVNRYEGTVNKFNGDNIMVLWGAPLEIRDPARKAVECALEMQRWIVAEREKGGLDVSFGFGINTGSVVAGFLGAKGRMEYTVIGDSANVASRLTAADIARRDQVVVSGATLREIGDDLEAVDLGAVRVKGRAEPVPCWQINRLGQQVTPKPAPAPDVPMSRAAVAGYH
ncbi:MAG TPA: adenylate/guanylate cyclase domain-containing protein [Candidatus Limnocylindria bacterium]|nr:adenylate/guanylate cyclase domain-containing protein [Candidatus Limnocylindria bacterium]